MTNAAELHTSIG